ncbi:arginine N-methyltransferase 2 [Xylariaceae sp. FL0016]|nr:arginine N-methyltransferase 2 [Xylariaceae sp. FL0016]
MSETKPKDDSLASRILPECPSNIATILHHAWQHDLAALKPLLAVPGRASTDGKAANIEDAKAVVHELFLSGAIWNDVDSNNETPGCLASRVGEKALYELCVDAGVRAELLFGLLDGYEEIESIDEEDEAETGDAQNDGKDTEDTANFENQPSNEPEDIVLDSDPDRAFTAPVSNHTVDSATYLKSDLTYTPDKLLDESQNGVMMKWETEIMERSVSSLLPSSPDNTGRRILNIGFGLGIIDRMFSATKPSKHHIIEAHPAVLAHISSTTSGFSPAWEASAPSPDAYKVHAGKWQDVIPQLLEKGDIYDAIYFDTFGEDYSQLRNFFTEHVPGLLDEGGIFSFFNGLGADRQVCYDVYTKVVEMHLSDAGMDVEWQDLDVDLKGLDKEGEGEWDGVKRRYWTLERYRLPICTFMG